MEEVTKCSYVNCVDSQEKEQIFHELPVCDIGLCVKWLINSGHEDLVGKDFNTLRSMKFFICNNHFTGDCYLSKGTLKENAVPRPHWNSVLRKRESHARNFSHAPNMNARCTSVEANPNDRSNTTQWDGNIKDLPNGKGMLPNGEYSDQWCRTCATKKPNLVSMIVKNKKTEMSLLSKLKLLIEIDDEDTLPLNMCWECVRKLEQSFQFFQQIYIADNTLRHIFPVSAYSKTRNIQTSTPLKSKPTDDECLEGKSNYSKAPSSCSSINHNSWRTSVNEQKPRAPTIKPSIISRTGLKKKQTSTVDKIVTKSSKSTGPNNNTRQTVLSFLEDPCYNDEELHWIDVLKIAAQQNREKSISSRGRVPLPSEMLVICEFCDAKFKLLNDLKLHLVLKHRRKIDNMCKDCIICYDNKALLLEHREIYHKDKRYTCDHCQCDFTRKSKLKEHINRIHVHEVYYACDICNEKFKSKEHLFEHIEALHLNSNSCSSNSSNSNSSTTSSSSTSSVDNRSTNPNVTKTEDLACNNATATTIPNVTESSTAAVITSTTAAPIAPTSSTTSTTCTNSTKAAEPPPSSTNQRFCPECEKPLDETMECSKCALVAESPLKRCKTEYRCEQCNSFFTDDKAFATHLETHCTTDTTVVPSQSDKSEKPEPGDTRCDECNIDLCNVKDVLIHRMQRHMIQQKDYTCLICKNNSFSALEDYEKHIDSHCKELKALT